MLEDLRDRVSGFCRFASPQDMLANHHFEVGRTIYVVASTNEYRRKTSTVAKVFYRNNASQY